jgi:hypothetical protein
MVFNFCLTHQYEFFFSSFFEPNTAIGTIAVPTKIAVRNRFYRKILKIAKQSIFSGTSRFAPQISISTGFSNGSKISVSIYYQLSVIG